MKAAREVADIVKAEVVKAAREAADIVKAEVVEAAREVTGVVEDTLSRELHTGPQGMAAKDTKTSCRRKRD